MPSVSLRNLEAIALGGILGFSGGDLAHFTRVGFCDGGPPSPFMSKSQVSGLHLVTGKKDDET